MGRKRLFRKTLLLVLCIALLISCVVPALAAEGTETSSSKTALYLGNDTTTQGHWEGKYGKDATILFGYNYTGVHDKNTAGRFLVPHSTNDYISKADDSSLKSFSYYCAGSLHCYEKTDDSILDMPSALSDRTKFLAGAYCGSPLSAYGGTYTSYFDLTMTNEDDYHVISIYGSTAANAAFDIVIEKSGTEILRQTMPKGTFSNGEYVSFLVPGSVKVYIHATAVYGASGIFVDKVADVVSYISDLTVGAGSEKRATKLVWNETDLKTGDTIVVERKTGDGAWEKIATLNAGAKTYQDSDLTAGTTYSYQLRVISGTTYSVATTAVTYTVPAYKSTSLTLDKELYTAKNLDEEITVKATLKDAEEQPLKNQTVALTLDWDFDEQKIESVTTDENGVAAFVFKSNYLGSATVTALFADNDTEQLNNSSATATLSVGETDWQYAPVIYKISDAVLPGELISINGYGFRNEDMTKIEIKYAPHTSASVEKEPVATAKTLANVQTDARDGFYVVTELPADADAGLYDIWVNNGNGWSEPVVLNASNPLFISEYEAWKGQSIELSGRSLLAGQFGADSHTKVRLVGTSNSYDQVITKNTPYSIVFTVDAPIGTYAVQVSNDNGVTWSGLLSGQTLSVVAEGNDPLKIGVAWMNHFNWSSRFDVTTYGADGTDQNDDTDAFNKAITAAHENGGVVYIPNGNYYVKGLKIPANVVLLGENTQGTVLYYNGTGENMFESDGDGQTTGHQGFANFSIRLSDDNTRPDAFFWLGHAWSSDYAYDRTKRQPVEFFIKGIDLEYSFDAVDKSTSLGTGNQRGLGVVALLKERFLVLDSSFVGYMASTKSCYVNEYARYDNVTYSYAGDCVQCSADYFFVENCHATGGLRKEANVENHGIFFRSFSHIENNYVEGMGQMLVNDGESFCCEMPNAYFNVGEVVNSSKNSVTVKTIDPLAESYRIMYGRLKVRVIAGKGMGQQLEVASIDTTTGKITLKGEWDVIPDSTSKFTLFLPLEYVTVYNNEYSDSGKGIYLYGQLYDCVAANNVSTDTEGIFVFSAAVKNERNNQSSFVSIRENVLTGVSPSSKVCNISIHAQRKLNGAEFYSNDVYGIEIRDNQITGVPGTEPAKKENGSNPNEAPPISGIVASSGVRSSDTGATKFVTGDIENILIENNYLKALDVAITEEKYGYGFVCKGNIFENVATEYNMEKTENKRIITESGLTKTQLDAFVKVWEKVSAENYTQKSYKALTDAIQTAKSATEANEIALAFQNLRIAAGGLVWKQNAVANGSEISTSVVDNRTENAVVTAPTSGWSEGTNTFTVCSSNACVVMISNDNGVTYTVLKASSLKADNTYSFTAENMTANSKIVVAIKGDANGDGKLTVADRVALNRSLLDANNDAYIALDAVTKCACDLNGDGKITVVDRIALNRALLDTENEVYLAPTWDE